MTLSDFMQKPLSEAVADMELVESKFHTDDNGQLQAVELKYRPKDFTPAATPTPKQNWRG